MSIYQEFDRRFYLNNNFEKKEFFNYVTDPVRFFEENADKRKAQYIDNVLNAKVSDAKNTIT